MSSQTMQELRLTENSAEVTGWRGVRLSDAQVGILLVLPAMVLFGVVILYPLFDSMYQGLFEKSLLWPGQEYVGTANLEEIIEDDFQDLLKVTLQFTVGATILPFLIGFGVALLLNANLLARGFWRGAFLLPWLVPAVVVSFLWRWIFNEHYGVINGVLGQAGLIQENIDFLGDKKLAMPAVVVAKTWNTFPWIAVMLLAGLQTIQSELYEAAAIDGADRLRSFWHITLPQLRGIIGTVLLLSFIWNFQHFETLYVMTTGGPARATTTFSVAVYKSAFQSYDLGEAGAIGILWMALLSVIVVVYLRFGVKQD